MNETADSAVPAADKAPSQEAKFDPEQFRLSPLQALERRRKAETIYFFDLREVEEFQEGHLPGAFSLPFAMLEDNLHRLPFVGDLVFSDGGEGLALQAARMLHDNGFTDQYYVDEGFTALREALVNSPDEIRYETLSEEERRKAIETVLDDKVRAFLERDGGGLEVREIDGDRIMVSYFGACGGCGSSTTGTLRFIQTALTIALNHDIEVVPID